MSSKKEEILPLFQLGRKDTNGGCIVTRTNAHMMVFVAVS